MSSVLNKTFRMSSVKNRKNPECTVFRTRPSQNFHVQNEQGKYSEQGKAKMFSVQNKTFRMSSVQNKAKPKCIVFRTRHSEQVKARMSSVQNKSKLEFPVFRTSQS